MHWSEVFGNYIRASEMLALARKAGLELEEFLVALYQELAKEDPDCYDVDAEINVEEFATQIELGAFFEAIS